MQIKKTIIKIVIPLLEAHGFHLRLDGQTMATISKSYDFVNEDRTREISYDFPPLRIRYLRISLSVFGAQHKFSIEMEQFRKMYDGHYENQAELDHLLITATENIVNIILPYLDALDRVFVVATNKLYHLLSEDTEEKAIGFSERHSIEFDPKYRFRDKSLISIIRALQSNDISMRKEDFQRCQDEVLGLAAFLGECERKSSPYLHWGWTQIPEFSRRAMELIKPQSTYGLILLPSDTAPAFDPLANILYAWNFSELETMSNSL